MLEFDLLPKHVIDFLAIKHNDEINIAPHLQKIINNDILIAIGHEEGLKKI